MPKMKGTQLGLFDRRELSPEAERLLGHFEVVAGAPGGTARLRELIVQLAIQGKLIKREPPYESALPLLGAANAERLARTRSGRSTGVEALAPVSPEEAPFVLPEGWVWTRIGLAMNLVNGRAFKPTDWTTSGVPIVRIQNLNNPDAPFNYCSFDVDLKFHLSPGDFLISWSGTPGTSFGAHIWDGPPGILNQHIFRAELYGQVYDPQFLRRAINARLDEMISLAHGGVGLQHITKGKLEAVCIPLPPIAEQKRIVTKLDELMKLCDDLEARLVRQRETAGRLTRSALDALASVEPEELTASWRRIDEIGDAILASPDHVHQLRLAIHSLAIQGKLVPQDPDDEPAQSLLLRILVKRAEVLGSRDIPQSMPTGLPQLPPGWVWTSLDALLIHLRNGISTAPSGDTGVPILRISAVRPNQVNVDDLRFLPGELSEYQQCALTEGDLLFTRYSGNAHFVGICGVVPRLTRATVYPDKLIRGIVPDGLLSPAYIAFAVNAGESRRYIDECVRTTAGQVGISGKQLKGTPVPLPPLAEQTRIVAKVDRLLALCDTLELRLRAEGESARRLADALVAELLRPS